MYHASYRKNSRKLQEKYSMLGVQIARKTGAISKKNQENAKKLRAHGH